MTEPKLNWWLHSTHFVIAVTLPLVLTLVAGCMKAKASKEDLGPDIPVDQVNQALARVVQKADFNTLAVGQSLYFSSTRRLENQETAITLGARSVEVIDRQDTDGKAQFTMRITNSQRQMNGNFLTTITEDHLLLNKGSDLPAAAIPASLAAPVAGGKLTAQSLVSSMATPQKKVTFHHLREHDESIDPPDIVKGRANCGGLSPCTIPVHYVQFDMVIWNTDTDYQKISLDFAFTTKTPFLPFGTDFDQLTGVLIVDCRSTYVPVDSRTVYVRDCLSLEDFQK